MLISLPEIQQMLEKKFETIPEEFKPDCSDILLNNSNISSDFLFDLEDSLKVHLPVSFKECILQYDFGNLTLGGVWFGSNKDYIRFLLENNDQTKYPTWWGNSQRPDNYLVIAGSDAYVIFLNTETGEVLACPRSNSWQTSTEIIAYNFETFVKAAATIFIQRQHDNLERLDVKITEETKCQNPSFWSELVALIS